VLLARVAEDLYWAARYVERAENTARIIREHTNLMVDLPESAPLSWEPLLAIAGESNLESTSEHAIVRALIADLSMSASIASCVARARANLRTCRETIPREYWLTINQLHLYVSQHSDEGVDRSSRSRFLTQVVRDCQLAVGVLGGVMSSDDAYEMLRLGRTIERADMTTRVLDVRAVTLMETGPDQLGDVLWGGVLRSLSALQMFQRCRYEAVDAEPVVDFLLHDPAFPRAVRCCIDKVAGSIARLPGPGRVLAACEDVVHVLDRSRELGTDAAALRRALDEIQLSVASLSNELSATYFAKALPEVPV
jgi:uncharacterized alpha-E superfamily protein